jgi:HEAT repeat protein
MLGGFETRVGLQEVRALGPTADAQLIAYAADEHHSRLRRRRAIALLRLAPSEASQTFLRQLIRDRRNSNEGADWLDLAAGLGSLAPYGTVHLEMLVSYLLHPSADVRQAVVQSLVAIGDRDALAPLRTRLIRERDPGVRSEVLRAIDRLTKPRPD